MKIDIDTSQLNYIKDMVEGIKNGYQKVVVGAINQTLTTAKVQAKARIGNELNLTAARIDEDLSIQKASYTKLYGALIAKGEPVGLINFGANQTMKGVSVKVLKASTTTLLKHAFIAHGKNSEKEHVFWRAKRQAGTKFPVGKKTNVPWPMFSDKYRMPLERLTGPRIEDIFAQPKVLDPVTIQANHLLLQNAEKNLDAVLQGYK
jgi:hypothetical protein